ncbi:MAG TPA: DUF4157 domain-containing protein [Pyrinomonadaceae bacterium]|nr:DUF4157 domain-containing protein [Pyrinomonadaceae bacterium]
MPDTPKENGRTNLVVPETVSHKPTPPGPVPIPYPNIGPAAKASGLPATVRHDLETKFGADLKDIEIYENHAPTMLGAKAFTSGNKIFFAPGSLNVYAEGKQLIGHEVAHVVQQKGTVVNKQVQEALESEPPAGDSE